MSPSFSTPMPSALPSWMGGVWNSVGTALTLFEKITGRSPDMNAFLQVEEKALAAFALTAAGEIAINPAGIGAVAIQALSVATKAIWDNLDTIFPHTTPAQIQPQLHAALALMNMNPVTGEGVA